jgi:hypothetical protein
VRGAGAGAQWSSGLCGVQALTRLLLCPAAAAASAAPKYAGDLLNGTYYPTSADTSNVNKRWYIIDAKGQTLGRLATLAATYIRCVACSRPVVAQVLANRAASGGCMLQRCCMLSNLHFLLMLASGLHGARERGQAAKVSAWARRWLPIIEWGCSLMIPLPPSISCRETTFLLAGASTHPPTRPPWTWALTSL